MSHDTQVFGKRDRGTATQTGHRQRLQGEAQAGAGKAHAMKRQLVQEQVGDEWYEYLPLGQFVVSAPAVCRGRPTFKYTRIEVAGVLERLGAGHPLEALIADSQGRLSQAAIAEAALGSVPDVAVRISNTL